MEQGADGSPLPDSAREHATVLVEALRRRITRRPERDHRSLFDLDDRLIELMGMVEEAAEAGAAISVELAQEIDAYLEAYRQKVDQIVGYWRWQQSIADISAKEAERLAARKKAAENRVTRLKGFLFAFMKARGIKKLEGEKSDIGMQRNSSASLVVDDPSQVAERFFERSVRFTKTEFQEILFQLPEGDARRRLEALLKDGWEVNGESVRASLVNNELMLGARLVTGSHLRIR
ncbi:MAG: siphovirus Gp157 family protein [Bryobacteraceae bacterium]|nr:siphovirus Gp157 family protein [Bryobacteraceae bacterium]